MNEKKLFINRGIVLLLILLFSLSMGCSKDNDPVDPNNNNTTGQSRDPNWLIGTWEGITPSSTGEYAGLKVRIEFTSCSLESTTEPVQGQTIKTYAYTGVFTWDVNGNAWSHTFNQDNWPNSDLSTVDYVCTQMVGNQIMEHISIRVHDEVNVEPSHEADFDWDALNSSSTAITQIGFWGDFEIRIGENYSNAYFEAVEGQKLVLVKQ
ncbi:MAG: hypothetical protein V1720_19305 [bacterium]